MKHIIYVTMLTLAMSGCTSPAYKPQPPFVRDGLYFWYQSPSVLIDWSEQPEQQIGTQHYLKFEEINALIQQVCDHFPEFDQRIKTSISLWDGHKIQKTYAVLNQTDLYYNLQSEGIFSFPEQGQISTRCGF